MKKLIKFLFLILFAHYVLGQNCEEATYAYINSGGNCLDLETAKKNAICLTANARNPCMEIECKDLTSTELFLYRITCSNVKESDEATCVDNTGGKTACKLELKVCSKGSGDSDEGCKKYPVESGNENSHICLYDSSGKKCFEQYFCEYVPFSTDGTQINCETYPVSLDKTDTHICVEDTSQTKPCKEQEKINLTTTLKEIVSSLISTAPIISTTPKVSSLITTVTSISTTPKVSSLITTILSISTTQIAKIIQSTIAVINTINIPTTFIQETKETSAILLGYSTLTMRTAEFTFVIYLLLFKNSRFFLNIMIAMVVIYNTSLRRLENYYSYCTLNEENEQTIISYNCVVKAPTANIKQIKMAEFDPKSGVKLVGITPIAKMYMENLIETNEKYGNLLSSNPHIYLLDNSTIEKREANQFDINGKIDGDKPKNISKNKNLTLMVNIESESETENKAKELDCTVKDIKGSNYTLTWTKTENLRYNLQSAVSIIDSELLLINFDMDNNENSSKIEPEIESKKVNVRNYIKHSKDLSGGAIVGIVLTCVVAVVAAISITYYFRKRPKSSFSSESTNQKINNAE